MLELCGSGYVIEHCMSALRIEREQRDFRRYVATGLYALVNGKTQYACTYEEVLNPQTEEDKKKQAEYNKEEEKRIKSNLMEKLGG